MARTDLGDLVRQYLQRVVNEQDAGAVDDFVSPEYRGRGLGWPQDIGGLRAFYRLQGRRRPDWHIEVQDTVEVGEWVAVRALASGHELYDEAGTPLPSPRPESVEWLAVYRVANGRIREVEFLSAITGPAIPAEG